MESGATLRWCRCRYSPSLFICHGASVSCSFGSMSGWITEYAGLMSLSGIRLLNSFAVRQSDLAVEEWTTSDKISDHSSVPPTIGHAGWCCPTSWTERLCANFTQIHEMRKLLSSNLSYQAWGAVQGQKTRTAPREWRMNSTKSFSSAATGVDKSSRREELSDCNSQMEHSDLDNFMNSRYDQVSLKRNQTDSEAVQSEEPEEDLLWKLKRNKNGKFDNVVAVLGDPRVLVAARDRLRERRWNWTVASKELEFSHVPKENKLLRSGEIDHNWCREAAHQLRSGSYSFKPAIRLQIAKRGRGEARISEFVRPQDQVIQEAIKGILERIYEHIVSDSGSGLGTSVHSALKSVKYGWKGISWFLQFDASIKDHDKVEKRLLKLLAEQIEDEAFLDALRHMFKLGTVRIGTNVEDDEPEGSVLSPMLRNIYFHHLDLEISRMKEEIKNGSLTWR